jgi:hypothetical protein
MAFVTVLRRGREERDASIPAHPLFGARANPVAANAQRKSAGRIAGAVMKRLQTPESPV